MSTTTNPNLIIQVERAFVSNLPAAPGAGTTAVLFSTHRCTLGTGGAAVKSTFVRGGGTQIVEIDADEFGVTDAASVKEFEHEPVALGE